MVQINIEILSLSTVWPCWCPIHSQKALIFYHDMKIMCFEKESYMLLLLLLPYIETEIQDIQLYLNVTMD